MGGLAVAGNGSRTDCHGSRRVDRCSVGWLDIRRCRVFGRCGRGAASTVEANAVNSDPAVGALSWGWLECDTSSTTALVVVDDRSTLGTVGNVLAGRAITHLIVEFDVNVFCHGNLILLNGERVFRARNLRALGELAGDTFALESC